jgi:hypothetical protein
MAMRKSVNRFLTQPASIVSTILISAALSYFTGGLGYLFGILVAFILLWSYHWKWSKFGINPLKWRPTILSALGYTLAIFILMDVIIQPIVEYFYGFTDLSSLEGIRGNMINYLIFIGFMWVVAGFGEEFLYRGFFMKHLAEVLGNKDRAWLISAIIISSIFGMAHLYQGVSGIITTGMVGFFLSMVFYWNRENLVLPMLVHGFYDMIGITLIFFGKERIIGEWVHSLV